MVVPWYYILIYVALGSLILGIFDYFKIIKSKSLRYFTVIFVYSLICWLIYDLVLTPE